MCILFDICNLLTAKAGLYLKFKGTLYNPKPAQHQKMQLAKLLKNKTKWRFLSKSKLNFNHIFFSIGLLRKFWP